MPPAPTAHHTHGEHAAGHQRHRERFDLYRPVNSSLSSVCPVHRRQTPDEIATSRYAARFEVRDKEACLHVTVFDHALLYDRSREDDAKLFLKTFHTGGILMLNIRGNVRVPFTTIKVPHLWRYI